MSTLGAERKYTDEYRALQQQIEKLIADTGPIYGTERTTSALMDLAARLWAQGWLGHERFIVGSLDPAVSSNPYLPQAKTDLDRALERGEARIDGSMY